MGLDVMNVNNAIKVGYEKELESIKKKIEKYGKPTLWQKIKAFLKGKK